MAPIIEIERVEKPFMDKNHGLENRSLGYLPEGESETPLGKVSIRFEGSNTIVVKADFLRRKHIDGPESDERKFVINPKTNKASNMINIHNRMTVTRVPGKDR